MGYTAYSLTTGGPEEIDGYHTLEAAVEDCLRMWPEDAFDIAIKDECGWTAATMEHGRTDPSVCNVFDGHAYRVESYRVVYTTGLDGRVQTVITELPL